MRKQTCTSFCIVPLRCSNYPSEMREISLHIVCFFLMVLKFLIVAYEIWKLKNSIRLGHQHGIQIHALIVMIIRRFHCYAAAQFNSSLSLNNASSSTKNDQLIYVNWNYLICFDGSFQPLTRHVGWGIAVYSSSGHLCASNNGYTARQNWRLFIMPSCYC